MNTTIKKTSLNPVPVLKLPTVASTKLLNPSKTTLNSPKNCNAKLKVLITLQSKAKNATHKVTGHLTEAPTPKSHPCSGTNTSQSPRIDPCESTEISSSSGAASVRLQMSGPIFSAINRKFSFYSIKKEMKNWNLLRSSINSVMDTNEEDEGVEKEALRPQPMSNMTLIKKTSLARPKFLKTKLNWNGKSARGSVAGMYNNK